MALVAAAGLSGCATTDSGNVTTDAIYAYIRATASGNGGTDVVASLQIGGPFGTYVRLSGGDSISARNASGTVPLGPHTDIFNATTYIGTLPGQNAGLVTVSLLRSYGASAPNSVANLPAPFSLTAPPANQPISRAVALAVMWSPSNSGSAMTIDVDGTCGDGSYISYFAPVSDTGAYTIPAGTLNQSSQPPVGSCGATITLNRVATGAVDPAYGGGAFEAYQSRSVAFISNP